MSHRLFLIKLLPEKYESDFLEGNLYLNTNVYFGAIDHTDPVRFDPHDGIDESLHVAKFEIQDHDGSWLPLPITGPISIRSDASAKRNMLCMFTATDKPEDSFDARNLAFGDRAVVIVNPIEFVARVMRAAKGANRPVLLNPIEYVERTTHSGPMGPFRKFMNYSYQNEFRFTLEEGSGEACRLPIGSIRDIAHTISSTHVPHLWQAMRSQPKASA